jgi:hypothetical protein
LTVSRRVNRASARKLRELMERRLDGYGLVALRLDGKTFAAGTPFASAPIGEVDHGL